MDAATLNNWRLIKEMLERQGKTDCLFYKRAIAILAGRQDPYRVAAVFLLQMLKPLAFASAIALAGAPAMAEPSVAYTSIRNITLVSAALRLPEVL